MAQYQYIARKASGERIAGVLQAESEAAAARVLDEQQLFPVRLTTATAENASGAVRGGSIRQRDVGVLYGQLADLLGSGVPMLRALNTVHRAVQHARLRELLGKVCEEVTAGSGLAEALAEWPAAFPELHVAMIRAGERGGFLEQVLTNLSTFIERVDDLRGRVRGALIYPMLLAIFGVIVVAVLLIWLVPQFKPMFKDMPLPPPTRILFWLSGVLLAWWWIVLPALAAIVYGSWRFIQSETGRLQWENWRLRLPVVGRLMRLVAITRFCRILGTMLDSGVPILQALAISKDATGSLLLSSSIEQAAEHVRGGKPLVDPLRDSGMFPIEVLEMIAVAEESNQLEKVLVQIAETVERRTTRQVDLAVRLVEPLMLTLFAGIIGFVAVGLFYPILNMAKTMK